MAMSNTEKNRRKHEREKQRAKEDPEFKEKLRERERARRKRRRERAKSDPELAAKLATKKKRSYERNKVKRQASGRALYARKREERARLNPDAHVKLWKAVRTKARKDDNGHVLAYKIHIRKNMHDHHIKDFKKTGRYQYWKYRKNNPKHKAISFMRKSLHRAFKQNTSKRTEILLGYSRKQLVEHITSLFQPGMSWENYGEWHIDHIRPIKHFLDSGIDCQREINCLENLQPLWARDNLKKSSNFTQSTVVSNKGNIPIGEK